MSENNVYSIKSLDEILYADEYIRDFEMLAEEFCHEAAERLALSIFEEFTLDAIGSVYLDRKQLKGNNIECDFTFDFIMEDNQPIVRYTGYVCV